ncbi:gene X product [Lineavirus I22]|nr:gene X product [Lineavirus I22]CAA32522.1 gene X product [Lineavirus I22]
MSGNTLLTDTQVINLPSALRMTYVCWKQGICVTDMVSRATYFRHRKVLKEFGIDIAVTVDRVDNSNVVPLIRVLEAKPASIPSQYDNLIFSSNRVSSF